ncbi:unnamed protein product, partial [Ectocarpus fasciculatus]
GARVTSLLATLDFRREHRVLCHLNGLSFRVWLDIRALATLLWEKLDFRRERRLLCNLGGTSFQAWLDSRKEQWEFFPLLLELLLVQVRAPLDIDWHG